jgi:hypothetical protein
MKKQWNKILLFTAALPFLFLGCNKDTESKFEVNSDAYIIRKKIDGEVKSAPAFYVYANQGISSATVTPPTSGGDPIELGKSEGSSFTFYKEPSPADFKVQPPTAGIYNFDVESSEGVKIKQMDELEIFNLQMPQITSTAFQSGSSMLNVKWSTVEDADGYVVKLLYPDGKIVFISFALTPSTSEFNISPSSGNWMNQIYAGEEVVLNVQSFIYDSDATLTDNIYNIGEIVVAEKEITWGQ